MKLTWNQKRALENLDRYPDGAPTKLLADPMVGIYPYLCGASARSAARALVRKGFAEVSDASSPMRYRITEAGRAALRENENA